MRLSKPSPVITIVGRPNVGKSSLLNYLVGRRVSIVDPTVGVTRDRVTAVVPFQGRQWEIIDTGGIGLEDPHGFTAQIQAQVNMALQIADAVLFVVDAREGVSAADGDIARRLHASGKPILLVANKADTQQLRERVSDFHDLAMGDPLAVSVKQRRGKHDILSWIGRNMIDIPDRLADQPQAIHITLVGRRNVGKSTLANHFIGEERVIVSDIPGTTRDAVDVPFEWRGQRYTAIDTAGLRKKRKIRDDIEFYGFTRTEASIRRADVVIHMLDAPGDISQVDKKIADEVVKQAKPCVLVINKWDLARGVAQKDFDRYLQYKLTGLHFVPSVYISAHMGKNIDAVLKKCRDVFMQGAERINTGVLNRIIAQMDKSSTMPYWRGKRARLYYAVQTGVRPPVFVVFVSNPRAFDEKFQRTIANRLRKLECFQEIPIQFHLRAHH